MGSNSDSMTTDGEEYILIFRRYRRSGTKVLDARAYGLAAWPMKVKVKR